MSLIEIADKMTGPRRRLLLWLYLEIQCRSVAQAESYIRTSTTITQQTLESIRDANDGIMVGQEPMPQSLVKAAQNRLAAQS